MPMDVANALRWEIFKMLTNSADPTMYPGDEIEKTIRSYVAAALRREREACADLVHDRLGADGYGVAQMIRARSNNSN